MPLLRLRGPLCHLLLVWTGTACATTSAGENQCPRPGGDVSLDPLMTAEEIAPLNAATALDVIRALRPDLLEPWAPPVGGGAAGVIPGIGFELAVSVDGEKPLHRRHLGSISAAAIREIEWLDRCQAGDEFSGAYPKGVVRIRTG